MKRFATAYTDLFENSAKVNIIDAENEIYAMIYIILLYRNDDDTKNYLNTIKNLSIDDFKNEILNSEQSIDVIKIN